MIWIILAIFLVVAVVTTIWRPQSILLWIWLVPNTCVNGLWQRLGVPLNAGYDDLYILLAFVVVLLLGRRGELPTGSTALKWILFYFGAVCVGNSTGYIVYTGQLGGLGGAMLREALKMFLFILVAIMTYRLVQTPRDLALAWRGLFLGVLGGAVLALYTYFDPSTMVWFGSPRSIILAEWASELRYYRMAGAFMEPNIAAMMFMIALTCVPIVWSFSGKTWKLIALGGAAFLLVCSFLTGSRTILLIGAVVALSFFRFKGYRVHLAVLVILAGIGALLYPGFIENTLVRIRNAQGTTEGRFHIWRIYLSALDGRRLLLGQGQWPSIVFDGQGFQGHNAFIDMITFYGIAGLVSGVGMFAWLWMKLRQFKRLTGPLAAACYSSGLLYLLVLGAMSMVQDALTPQSMMLKSMFFVMVLTERGFQLAADPAYQLEWAEADYEDAYVSEDPYQPDPAQAAGYGCAGK